MPTSDSSDMSRNDQKIPRQSPGYSEASGAKLLGQGTGKSTNQVLEEAQAQSQQLRQHSSTMGSRIGFAPGLQISPPWIWNGNYGYNGRGGPGYWHNNGASYWGLWQQELTTGRECPGYGAHHDYWGHKCHGGSSWGWGHHGCRTVPGWGVWGHHGHRHD